MERNIPAPGPSESGFWRLCVCGAPHGAHGWSGPAADGTKGFPRGWVEYAHPCAKFRAAELPKDFVAGTPPKWRGPGRSDDEVRVKRRKKDRFLEALKAETTIDRYSGKGSDNKVVRRLR